MKLSDDEKPYGPLDDRAELSRLRDVIVQQAKEIAELRKALEPFADYADTWPPDDEPFYIDKIRYTDAYEFGCRWRNDDGKQIMMKLGHYRAARRLLGRKPAMNKREA